MGVIFGRGVSMKRKEIRNRILDMVTHRWMSPCELLEQILRDTGTELSTGLLYSTLMYLEDVGEIISRYRDLTPEQLAERNGCREIEVTRISSGTCDRSRDAILPGLVPA
jgi:DNA-binding PadR family transcriptional regulator